MVIDCETIDHVGSRDASRERALYTHVSQVAAKRVMRMKQAVQVLKIRPGLVDVQLQVREAILSPNAILALDTDALVEIAELINVPAQQAGRHLRSSVVH